jgi:hypothetical protein
VPALSTYAIHIGILNPLPDGRVLVETRESMDVWLIDRLTAPSPKNKSQTHEAILQRFAHYSLRGLTIA